MVIRFMSTEAAPATAPVYSHKNPFPALHPVNAKLTGTGSEKDTRHHEISLEGSGLSYQPGDALGLVPANCHLLVEELIAALRATGDEPVPGKDGTPKPLREALLKDYAITSAEKKFVEAAAAKGVSELAEMLKPENADQLKVFLTARNAGHDYVDILRKYPQLSFAPEEFVKLLRKMAPRHTRSHRASHGTSGLVHLTVATVHGRRIAGSRASLRRFSDARRGVAQASSCKTSKNISACRRATHTDDHGRPRHWGGALTRSSRSSRARAKGKNWLFFGEQQRGRTSFMKSSSPDLWPASSGSIRRSRGIRRKKSTCRTGCEREGNLGVAGCGRGVLCVWRQAAHGDRRGRELKRIVRQGGKTRAGHGICGHDAQDEALQARCLLRPR